MKALALVDAPDHVCCRYRIRAFAPALAAAGIDLTIQGIPRSPLKRISQLLGASRYDLVILQRKLLPVWQLAILRKMAKQLIFDYDDAVLYRDSFDPRGSQSKRRISRFAQTVRLCDTVIAGNDFLADCALRAGARAEDVRVIPTCVDPHRYPIPKAKTSASGLALTWIGSSSTLQGLERERSLWERLGQEVPGLKLRVVCDRFPDFQDLPVVNIPWSEATEAEELAQADVGLGWVPDDLWSRGKCGLKVLQYGAAGLPVVANPVGVHPEMVVPGVTGFLPESTEDWIKALKTLSGDERARHNMGRAARQMIEARYAVDLWSSAFVGAVAGTHAPARPRISHAASPVTRPTVTSV